MTTSTALPATLSDAAVLRRAIARVSFPAKDLRSFSLHAPLELLARYALLGHVEPGSRALVRLQLHAAAEHYQRTTELLAFRRADAFDPSRHDLPLLLEQISAWDIASAAETTSGLVLGLSVETLVQELAPATLDTLAAAGHAPILFPRLRSARRPSAGHWRRPSLPTSPPQRRRATTCIS